MKNSERRNVPAKSFMTSYRAPFRAQLRMAVMVLALTGSTLTTMAQTTTLAPFELRNQHGKLFTQVNLLAKPSVIHFGFTSCPVICPTTLYELAQRMRELGPLADQINFVFVTVDPDKDTSAHLKTYIDSFDPRIVGLTGDVTQISVLTKWLGASFSKIESATGGYTMDHTVNAFLIARGGTAITPLYMGDNAKERAVMTALRTLAAGGT